MRLAVYDDEYFFTDKLKKYLECVYKSLDFMIEEFESGESLLAYS